MFELYLGLNSNENKSNEIEEPDLSRNKIEAIIRKMTTNKSPGSDNVSAKIFKKEKRLYAHCLRKTTCSNYRGIGHRMENTGGDYQCEFKIGRNTTDQIFTLKEVEVESYEHWLPSLVLFIDFKHAHGRIKRSQIFNALEELRIRVKLKKGENNVTKGGKYDKSQ